MSKNALLLGVYYSKIHDPSRGQGYRDRVRCEALELHGGYNVYSLDNKHSVDLAKEGKHCQANFADCRRMASSIEEIWENDNVLKHKFNTIILDYFFSPAGWARERWTEPFFGKTLPYFAESNLLKENGTIWLPHLEVVSELLEQFKDEISKYYEIIHVQNPKENPLYHATEYVANDLRKCPDNLTNLTQMKPYDQYSDSPFICLKRRKHVINNEKPTTPKKQRAVSSSEKGIDLNVILASESPEKRARRY